MPTPATHEDFNRKHAVQKSSDRSFGIVFAVFFSIVGFWPLRIHQPARSWAIAAGGAFLVLAFAQPILLRPLNRLWTKFGLLLGRIMNPVVTGLLFFLVVTPTGLLIRLLGKDPLRLAADTKAASYWIDRKPPGPPSETMPNQF